MLASAFRVPMKSPDDIAGIVELIEGGLCLAQDIVCIMGKTEGNGCVNDFTRGFSTYVLRDYISQSLDISPVEVE